MSNKYCNHHFLRASSRRAHCLRSFPCQIQRPNPVLLADVTKGPAAQVHRLSKSRSSTAQAALRDESANTASSRGWLPYSAIYVSPTRAQPRRSDRERSSVALRATQSKIVISWSLQTKAAGHALNSPPGKISSQGEGKCLRLRRFWQRLLVPWQAKSYIRLAWQL